MRNLSVAWLKKRNADAKLIEYVAARSKWGLIEIMNGLVSEGQLYFAHWLLKETSREWDVRRSRTAKADISPYWEDHRTGTSECSRANPDVISDEEGALWPERIDTNQAAKDLQFDAIRTAYSKATLAERKSFDLIGAKKYTFQQAANELGTSKSNVHEAFTRFKNRCEEQLEKLKQNEPNK